MALAEDGEGLKPEKRKRKKAEDKPYGGLGDPKTLELLKAAELLEKSDRKLVSKKGLTKAAMAGLSTLNNNSELNGQPLQELVNHLKDVNPDKVTIESYHALGSAIQSSLSLTLKAALNTENELLRTVYLDFYNELYRFRFEKFLTANLLFEVNAGDEGRKDEGFLGEDLKDDSSKGNKLKDDKSVGKIAAEVGLKAAFFAAFEGFIKILEDYFMDDEPGSEGNFFIGFLRAIYESGVQKDK
ncbi:hypothetical protein IC229_28910 [Spirosoma sp. BT702]|uniref:Uncharacterized protein n=1 Tax=Spirosoma profusum TaxID=2771354 RepID=A0A927G9L8_9BACT|nr:hypothetical protein [Spirosoma profusum]MBD2704691.1 hypothetical protein [Spirosoma profusum]